jgi:predicted RNase H-like HicB family nuclease
LKKWVQCLQQVSLLFAIASDFHKFVKSFMKNIYLKNIVWQEGEQFVAQCLNVDVSSFGNTKEEALSNLNEALELFFEDAPVDDIQAIENLEIITTSLVRA